MVVYEFICPKCNGNYLVRRITHATVDEDVSVFKNKNDEYYVRAGDLEMAEVPESELADLVGYFCQACGFQLLDIADDPVDTEEDLIKFIVKTGRAIPI